MRLVQYLATDRRRRIGVPTDDGQHLQVLRDATHVYALALEAHRRRMSLAALVAAQVSEELEDYPVVVAAGRLLAPFDHPTDGAHFVLSGTGLDHTGSALADR